MAIDDSKLKAIPSRSASEGTGDPDPNGFEDGELLGTEPPESEEYGDGGEGKSRRRGIYLLPNLITTGALFAGFFAIVAGMNGDFVAAALAIIAAGLLDTADGRVARWTRTESRFGAEYDSLSDMVAFGVGPALVAFSWGLDTLGKAGWVATFVYMACAALRLARFNTKGDNKTFTGLASPAAAAIIACLVWAWTDFGFGEPSTSAAILMAVVVVCVGLLMVSNFIYFSPKMLELRGRVPFITLVAVVLVFAILFVDPPRVLLLVALAYAASGPLQHYWRRWRRYRRRRDEGVVTESDAGAPDSTGD
jgi:CDP-diacylglycerol--serine O-phosphatidyltransferase